MGELPPQEATVYVDGFNLYYRCLRGGPNKWLDLSQVCARLLPGFEIKRIRYFTAVVQSRPEDPQQQQRQQMYLRALGTIPNLSIHLGSFRTDVMRMPLAHPPPNGPKTVAVLKTAEKGSDVNLATEMLVDAFVNDCSVAIVLSNDSDLKGPIDAVRKLGHKVGILVPGKTASRSVLPGDFHKPIRQGLLAVCQFQDVLQDENGAITRPAKW